MNEPSNTPMTSGMPSASEPFYQTWIKAVTKPSEQTYAEISDSPDSNPNKAYIWMAVVGAISGFLGAVASVIFPAATSGSGRDLGGGLITIIIATALGAILSPVFFAIGIAIIQWIAKLFGGVGTYSKLIYLAATFAAPLGLVSGALSGLGSIPSVGICFSVVSLGVGLYSLYLEVLAVKVVNKLDWGKATATVLIPSLIVVFLCACLIAVGVSSLVALSGAGQ